MIDRRTFIGTLAGGLLASPLTTFAQQPTKLPRIGVLGSEDAPPWEGFRRGLRDLGYIDGRNITMEWRWSEGRTDRLPALAIELVKLQVDIIVASGTQAVRSAKQATSTIPIVMAVSAYPDKIGLVESLARPGGNVTGLSNLGPELMGKSFQLLKEIAPKVSRVAVLWNPASPVEALGFKEILAAAPGAGVEIQSIEVRTPDEYAAAFATVTASRADALFAFGNPVNFKNRQLIADFAFTVEVCDNGEPGNAPKGNDRFRIALSNGYMADSGGYPLCSGNPDPDAVCGIDGGNIQLHKSCTGVDPK